MGIGFGAVESLPKSNIIIMMLNPLIGRGSVFYYATSPATLVGGPSVYTTGFPEGWRNQTFR